MKLDLIKHGLVQIFISFDQLLNVLLTPFSWETWADETMSSRCGRLQHRSPYKYYAKVINFLFYFQERDFNHCRRAYEKELTRYQFPPEMR
jgi:hypothetical protein